MLCVARLCSACRLAAATLSAPGSTDTMSPPMRHSAYGHISLSDIVDAGLDEPLPTSDSTPPPQPMSATRRPLSGEGSLSLEWPKWSMTRPRMYLTRTALSWCNAPTPDVLLGFHQSLAADTTFSISRNSHLATREERKASSRGHGIELAHFLVDDGRERAACCQPHGRRYRPSSRRQHHGAGLWLKLAITDTNKLGP